MLVLLPTRMNISYYPLRWVRLGLSGLWSWEAASYDRCSGSSGLHHFECMRRRSALSANQALLFGSTEVVHTVHMDAYLSQRSGIDLAPEALSPLSARC